MRSMSDVGSLDKKVEPTIHLESDPSPGAPFDPLPVGRQMSFHSSIRHHAKSLSSLTPQCLADMKRVTVFEGVVDHRPAARSNSINGEHCHTWDLPRPFGCFRTSNIDMTVCSRSRSGNDWTGKGSKPTFTWPISMAGVTSALCSGVQLTFTQILSLENKSINLNLRCSEKSVSERNFGLVGCKFWS